MKRTFVLVMGMMFLVSCASAPPNQSSLGEDSAALPKTSFLGEYAKNLTPGQEGGAKMRWLKPGVNFAKYNKFIVDYVVFALADDSESKVINGDEMKKLGDAASLALVNAIKEKYPVVAEPGPDVARISAAIVGLKQSNPILSGISSVVPIGLGISVVKKGAAGSWSGSGATRAEFMIRDSMTDDVIAVAYDERTAGFTERFTKWGSAEEAFKFWGERGVKSLEAIKAKQ